MNSSFIRDNLASHVFSQQEAKNDVVLRVIKKILINIGTPTAWKPTDVFMCGKENDVTFSCVARGTTMFASLHLLYWTVAPQNCIQSRGRESCPYVIVSQPGLHLIYGRTCSTSFHDKLNQSNFTCYPSCPFVSDGPDIGLQRFSASTSCNNGHMP